MECESSNYIWNQRNVLGSGACGIVYMGLDKKNGKAVAVKTFHKSSKTQPDIIERELEILKMVNHENVVALLAIERVLQSSTDKVIIMELCSGSLWDMLNEPSNKYGLSDKDFTVVCKNLSDGVKYLRSKNLVHRDLKPGNILKYYMDDGQSIYKLADFGMARELAEDETFNSFVGTAEYVHPNIYKRILNRSLERRYDANYDLWSIGVTLYQLATGILPFRPFGGRSNPHVMLHMTSEKELGVISAVQHNRHDKIEWSKTLPASCQLNDVLKVLVTQLIAGLLESEPARMWKYDEYFNKVECITNMRIIHIFYANQLLSIQIYISTDKSLKDLQNEIFLQTQLPVQFQILVLDNDRFESRIGSNTTIGDYPPTTVDTPIFLYNIYMDIEPQLIDKLDIISFPIATESVLDPQRDARWGKENCTIGHEYKRRIEKYSRMDMLMKAAVKQFNEMLRVAARIYLEKNNSLKSQIEVVNETMKLLESIFGEQIKTKLTNLSEEVESVLNINITASNILELINRGLLMHEDCLSNKKGPSETRSVYKANHLVRSLHSSWEYLKSDCELPYFNNNSKCFHYLEMKKIESTGIALKSLLVDDVQKSISDMAECFSDWYKNVRNIKLEVKELEEKVILSQQNLKLIREELINFKNVLTLEDLVSPSSDIKNNVQNMKLMFEQMQNAISSTNTALKSLPNIKDI